MRVKDILVIATLIAALILIVRTVLNAPFLMEGFATKPASALLNSATECPSNTKMYMYEGKAYCCSTTINADADRLADTCKPNPLNKSAADFTFCTLGPSDNTVKNCLEERSGFLQALGEKVCPPSKPNLALGPMGSATALGRCCSSAANQDMTDCVDLTQTAYCDVSSQSNYFMAPTSCQFERARETDPVCPTGFSGYTGQGTGALQGLTLYGCQDSNQICYSQAMLNSLKEFGYNTAGMKVCSSASASS
jgi:hypothetical protein